MSLKNPVTTPGIDPGTVRLVAQRLNHYATPGGYGMDGREILVRFSTGIRGLSVRARGPCRLWGIGLGSGTQAYSVFYAVGTVVLFCGRESGRSPSSAVVKNEWNHTSTPTHASMACWNVRVPCLCAETKDVFFLDTLTVEDRAETSVTDYLSVLRNSPEERRSRLHRCGNLKSCSVVSNVARV